VDEKIEDIKKGNLKP